MSSTEPDKANPRHYILFIKIHLNITRHQYLGFLIGYGFLFSLKPLNVYL